MHHIGYNTLQTISSIENIKVCNKGADDKVKLLGIVQQKHLLITLKKPLIFDPGQISQICLAFLLLNCNKKQENAWYEMGSIGFIRSNCLQLQEKAVYRKNIISGEIFLENSNCKNMLMTTPY